MSSENKIRKEIFRKIEKLYRIRKAQENFKPGKTRVNYGGRVYDEKDMLSLVDSSLDFWLTAGRFAEKFEKELAQYLGMKYCLLVNSGSSANLLAVSALTSPLLKNKRLKAGDEVVTTACGFPTTLNPILQNNLLPVFVDVELGNYNIKIKDLEKAISRKTKAIFLPHTLGNPFDLDKISKLARKHGLWLIEDNCDALGSKYKGRFTGSFGHISTCSFYPPHMITTGEGGAVLTSDPLLKKIIASFRDWGRDCWCESGEDNNCKKRFSRKSGKLPFGYDHKYIYSHVGYNLRMTDMQAAIGLSQLKKLNGFIKARQSNFLFLYQHLSKYGKYFIMPIPEKNSKVCWFGFPILIRENAPFSREELVSFIEENKIATRMLFGGNLIRQPAYEKTSYRSIGKLKNTDIVMNNLFWIGVYPGITSEMRNYIIKIFDKFFQKIK